MMQHCSSTVPFQLLPQDCLDQRQQLVKTHAKTVDYCDVLALSCLFQRVDCIGSALSTDGKEPMQQNVTKLKSIPKVNRTCWCLTLRSVDLVVLPMCEFIAKALAAQWKIHGNFLEQWQFRPVELAANTSHFHRAIGQKVVPTRVAVPATGAFCRSRSKAKERRSASFSVEI